jgi:hypothetical protein
VIHADLAKKLTIWESLNPVAVKINRGVFPTWFFMASMKVAGKQNVTLDDD